MAKLRKGAAALTLAAVLIVATASLAQAITCASTRFCAWTGNDFTGTKVSWEFSDNSWSSPIRNNDDSAYNNGTSGLVVRSYTDDGYNGTVIVCLPRGWAVDFVTPDDNGESHRWESTACSNPGP
jgi:hypothetical protein